ncbi:MAG: nuclear transport factor 2 family protein [Methanobacterium sp.]|nr:nuclear transport factor 2 family protein [Methanobacterium sp.]
MSLKNILIKKEELRKDAWINKDVESFLNLLADDFHEINIFGCLDKDFIIKNIFYQLELLEFDMSNFRLVTSGEDTAILIYQCYEKLILKEELTGYFNVSAIYKKVDDDWKLLLWQITPSTPI